MSDVIDLTVSKNENVTEDNVILDVKTAESNSNEDINNVVIQEVAEYTEMETQTVGGISGLISGILNIVSNDSQAAVMFRQKQEEYNNYMKEGNTRKAMGVLLYIFGVLYSDIRYLRSVNVLMQKTLPQIVKPFADIKPYGLIVNIIVNVILGSIKIATSDYEYAETYRSALSRYCLELSEVYSDVETYGKITGAIHVTRSFMSFSNELRSISDDPEYQRQVIALIKNVSLKSLR